jgi:hypothetical protein
MLYEYATNREAAQAAWGYASGRQDERGEGDLPRDAGSSQFAEAYSRAWTRHKNGRSGYLPSLAAAWANWWRCNDNDEPLSVYEPGECDSCGLVLTKGTTVCPSGLCVPVAEREVYAAFRALTETHELREDFEPEEAASKTADVVAAFGRFARDGDVLRRWISLYMAGVRD